MTEGLIGVIVPVYKVEKYIAECIESILAQRYTNFRLILVDDGTPDNAGKICDEYAQKDPRITVIHQENAGVTSARAKGVEEASDCEFVTFVDGDDILKTNALQTFYNEFSEDTDIVMSRMDIIKAEEIKHKQFYNKESLSIKEFKEQCIFLRGGIGGRMYRRKLFDEYTFNTPREIVFGEDSIMNLRIAFNTNKNVKIIDSPLYLYRQHNGSCCSTFCFSEEYEEKLIEHLYSSIPQNKREEYSQLFAKRRLWAWERRYNNSFRRPEWGGSTFHRQLLSDIEKENIPIGFFNKLLLTYTNPFIRFLIIYCRKTFSFCIKN